MAKNEYIKNGVEEPKEILKKTEKLKESKVGITLRSVLDGSVLTKEAVVRLLPLGLYISVLIVTYIGVSYNSEKNIRKINKTRNELKELEFEYISTKSDLMHLSKQSEVAIRIDSLKIGVKESVVPPIKLFESYNPWIE